MKKKRIFAKPITFLVLSILAITAFTEGNLRNWLSLGAFAVAGLLLIIPFLWSKRGKINAAFKKRTKRFRLVKISKTSQANTFRFPDVSDSVPDVMFAAYAD